MLKNEIVSKNPLRVFDQNKDGGLLPGQTALLAARAGTGKTAFLIQVALDNLFRGNTVLHVSIGETVSHVKAWYEEIFRDLAAGYDLEQASKVWDDAVMQRLILTFKVDAFSVEKLKERITDLTEQNIFAPRVVIIDKLELNQEMRPALEDLASFAREMGVKVWVCCRTHREAGNIRDMLVPYEDIFHLMIALEPKGDTVSLTAHKNPSGVEGTSQVVLDPKTLLLAAND